MNSELTVGCYYMQQGTSLQKMRLLAGILQEYNQFPLGDFGIFHQGDSMLVIVIPKVSNQLQDELSRQNRSKCGVYSLHQCINLMLEHSTPSIASQLNFPDEMITVNFLRPFDYETRQIGKFRIHNTAPSRHEFQQQEF